MLPALPRDTAHNPLSLTGTSNSRAVSLLNSPGQPWQRCLCAGFAISRDSGWPSKDSFIVLNLGDSTGEPVALQLSKPPPTSFPAHWSPGFAHGIEEGKAAFPGLDTCLSPHDRHTWQEHQPSPCLPGLCPCSLGGASGKADGNDSPKPSGLVLSLLFQTWALATTQDHSRSPSL